MPLLFAACRQATPIPIVAESTPEPVPIIAPASTPQPLPATTPGPLPIEPARYFLLVRKSIETDAGLVGINPGRELRRLTSGQYEIEGALLLLSDDEVTTNPKLAHDIIRADFAGRAMLRQKSALEARKAKEAQSIRDATPSLPEPVQQRAPMGSSALDRGAYDERKGVAKPPVLLNSNGGRIRMR